MRNKNASTVNSGWKNRIGVLMGVPVVLFAIAGGVWFFRKSNRETEHRDPANAHVAAEIPNKPKFESPIFQALQKKDWTKLAELLAAPTPPADTKLTQLIYFLDSKKLDPDSSTPFFKTVMTWVDASGFKRARESQLLSHVLGKLKLRAKEKKQVEATFTKNGWRKKRPWTQVSVSWVPMPDSTFQDLKTLLQPGRIDLTADFVHFISKVNDEKAKKKLLSLAKSAMQKFAPDQQKYLSEHLKNLTAAADTKGYREQ